MKMIVGLGNPGQKYRNTRHNIGFMVIAELHQRFGNPRPSSKFDSELVQIQVSSDCQKVLLQSPLTFMNASGRSVRAAADFFKIPVDDILIICDDMNLDLGRLRYRPTGSAGGQNGLKDIIQKLGTQDFARLRIGVGKPPDGWDVSNYVLSKFNDEEKVDVEKAVKRAADSALVWLDQGVKACMNRYNSDPNKPKPVKKPRPAKPEPGQSKGGPTETGKKSGPNVDPEVSARADTNSGDSNKSNSKAENGSNPVGAENPPNNPSSADDSAT